MFFLLLKFRLASTCFIYGIYILMLQTFLQIFFCVTMFPILFYMSFIFMILMSMRSAFFNSFIEKSTPHAYIIIRPIEITFLRAMIVFW